MTRATSTTPPLAWDATKSSHRWTETPGNWDRLNLRALFTSDTNEWGIPDLPAARWVPARLVAYNDRPGIDRAARDETRRRETSRQAAGLPSSRDTTALVASVSGRDGTSPAGLRHQQTALHFFLDDYRFETVWSKPERGLSRCHAVGAALTPDFSLWTTMPLAMQLWQVYRSRWCGAWLLHHGVQVVPTVSWSTPDSYWFAFAGIPTGSVVAVSTVGIIRADTATRARFADGYAAMLHRLQPTTVLVYGRTLPEPALTHTPAGTEVRYYPTRWATHEAHRTEQVHGGSGR